MFHWFGLTVFVTVGFSLSSVPVQSLASLSPMFVRKVDSLRALGVAGMEVVKYRTSSTEYELLKGNSSIYPTNEIGSTS